MASEYRPNAPTQEQKRLSSIALACLQIDLDEFCKEVAPILYSRIGQPDQDDYIRTDYVQTQLGTYAVVKAMSEAGWIGGDFNAVCGNTRSLDNLLYGHLRSGAEKRPALDLTSVPILAKYMEDAAAINAIASGKAGGKGSRRTKKKGKKSRKYRQKGGAIRDLLIRILCNALTGAIFYGIAISASKGAGAMGLPTTLTGMSGALANLLIQGNLIKSACGDSASIGVHWMGSWVGVTQTCEAIALENEVQLANLTAYVATALGVSVGSIGTKTYDQVYAVVCRLINSIVELCSRGTGSIANMINGRVDFLALQELNEEIGSLPELSDEIVARDDAAQLSQGIIKTLAEYVKANPRNNITPASLLAVKKNLESERVKGAFVLSAKSVLDTVGVDDLAALGKALTEDEGPEGFMPFFRECVKHRNCQPEPSSSFLGRIGFGPTAKNDGSVKHSAEDVSREERNRRLLVTANPAEERQAAAVEAARRQAQQADIRLQHAEAERVQREQQQAEAEVAVQVQPTVAAPQTLGRRRRDDSEEERRLRARRDPDETKASDSDEEGAMIEGGRRRRRRRTSKAKKYHKKGKKSHKSKKGKKANRKTKKHHKKANKSHRKSRKH